jgi:beta-glucosidase
VWHTVEQALTFTDAACHRRAVYAWPGPIAVAATWNLELGEQKAIAHGSESFDKRSAVVRTSR